MPLLHFYHSENVFSAQDKQEIASKITSLYERVLPRFYVNVLFHALKPENFYIGSLPVDDFVRVSIDHIARSFDDDKSRNQFLSIFTAIVNPYIADRGLRWELHIDETPIELWTIQGMVPPPPFSEAESKWRSDNFPSAY